MKGGFIYLNIMMTTENFHSSKPIVITIDGPTASGKGTVAQRVADKLGFHYLDSGALYRLVALSTVRLKVPLDDYQTIARIARNLSCQFVHGRILLEDEDVSDQIRAENIGNAASIVAAYPLVRDALKALQIRFRQAPGLVTDGRDMGTVIFPDADLKIFLTASVTVRAERRYKQLLEKGFSANMNILREDLEKRDKRDSERESSPLLPANDSVIIDTSSLSIEESVQYILNLFAKKKN